MRFHLVYVWDTDLSNNDANSLNTSVKCNITVINSSYYSNIINFESISYFTGGYCWLIFLCQSLKAFHPFKNEILYRLISTNNDHEMVNFYYLLFIIKMISIFIVMDIFMIVSIIPIRKISVIIYIIEIINLLIH